MKKLILGIILLVLVAIGLTGCYIIPIPQFPADSHPENGYQRPIPPDQLEGNGWVNPYR